MTKNGSKDLMCGFQENVEKRKSLFNSIRLRLNNMQIFKCCVFETKTQQSQYLIILLYTVLLSICQCVSGLVDKSNFIITLIIVYYINTFVNYWTQYVGVLKGECKKCLSTRTFPCDICVFHCWNSYFFTKAKIDLIWHNFM